MKITLTIVCLFLSLASFSQKQDHIWYFGYNYQDNIYPESKLDSTWGGTNFDFNYDPPKIHYDSSRIWDIDGTNTSICDANGQMLVYSNGQAVYNGRHQVIEDTINYCPWWNNWSTWLGYEQFAQDLLK